jgi:hypothetical protein
MPPPDEIHMVAAALFQSHGPKARQIVVDRMIEAIRAFDMRTAHYWDDVGKAVDDLSQKKGPAAR